MEPAPALKGEEVMKRQTVNTIRILAVALLSIAGAAAARADDDAIVARVPFNFIVGTAHMPAGKYIVKPASDDLRVVLVESSDGHSAAMSLTVPVASDVQVAAPELVFEKRGNQYFLARLIPADGNEREIPATRARSEREVAVAGMNP
jgi:hypothetical protein